MIGQWVGKGFSDIFEQLFSVIFRPQKINQFISGEKIQIDQSFLFVTLSNFLPCFSAVSPRKPSLVRGFVSRRTWMELAWICVTHRPCPSLLMCCREAAVSSNHERPREWSGISSSGDAHVNVWLRELLCDQG